MKPGFNQRVSTALGQGNCSGVMQRQDGTVYLVRLPVNEQTQPHLRDANCLTPKANRTGLWTFSESELQ